MTDDSPKPITDSYSQIDEKATDGLPSQDSEKITPDWDRLKSMVKEEGDELNSVINRMAWTFNRRYPDAGDDIAQEAVLRAAIYIAKGGLIHKNICATLFETARRVWLEFSRNNKPSIPLVNDESEPIQIAITAPNIEEQIVDTEIREIRFNCMRQCFNRLSREEQMFLAGHSTAENKSEYAVKHGMAPDEGRMKAFTLRTKIRQCRDRCCKKHL